MITCDLLFQEMYSIEFKALSSQPLTHDEIMKVSIDRLQSTNISFLKGMIYISMCIICT